VGWKSPQPVAALGSGLSSESVTVQAAALTMSGSQGIFRVEWRNLGDQHGRKDSLGEYLHHEGVRSGQLVSSASGNFAELYQTRCPLTAPRPFIDVGGGESTLVDDLLEQGFRDITVLDVSQAALDVNMTRLGKKASGVHWIAADITQVELEPRAYDIWHDRAVFHFLTRQEQRAAYVRQVARSVKPGGHVIVSTFGPEGSTKCSGLEVVRYDADSLHDEFGSRFRLVESSKEMHQTPFGTTQQFLYCYCRVE